MFVSGDPLRSPGPRGEQLLDSVVPALAQRLRRAAASHLPENDWVQHGEVVLSTDDRPSGRHGVKAGQDLVLGPRAVLVIRST